MFSFLSLCSSAIHHSLVFLSASVNEERILIATGRQYIRPSDVARQRMKVEHEAKFLVMDMYVPLKERMKERNAELIRLFGLD